VGRLQLIRSFNWPDCPAMPHALPARPGCFASFVHRPGTLPGVARPPAHAWAPDGFLPVPSRPARPPPDRFATEPAMTALMCSLQNLLRRARRWTPSIEVALALAVVAALAASLFYLAGLLSPELALLLGR